MGRRCEVADLRRWAQPAANFRHASDRMSLGRTDLRRWPNRAADALERSTATSLPVSSPRTLYAPWKESLCLACWLSAQPNKLRWNLAD